MDEIRKFILDTAHNRGLDLKELSTRLGKNHAYMHQYIHRGIPKKLHGDDRALLSHILRVPEVDLGAPPQNAALPNAIFPLESHPSNATISRDKPEIGPAIPLYGTAVGGVDGQFELNGNLLDRVKAPVSLYGVRDAYAVLVAGDSMEPRYEDGETVYVNPDRRPTRNDYVVAQIKTSEDGAPQAYIKKWVRWNSERLVLRQFNPEKELEFDGRLVESVHYVLRSGE
jgi:phage repressor protein C with HTH and peptisase S24 domain